LPSSAPFFAPIRETPPPFDPTRRAPAPVAPKPAPVIHPVWNAYLSQNYNLVKTIGGADVTANRPMAGLFIGYPFFDESLGIPIWVQSLNPTVWVNSAGTPV
jgi:hypothetical protein